MRRPIVVGNWKMHLLREEASALVRQLRSSCDTDAVDVVVCPPFTALAAVAPLLTGSRIGLGAQDVFWEPQGAFTGEVSPRMLVDAGCRYVIIGHSERRTHFGETDQTVNKKLQAMFTHELTHELTPILCVGETLEEREALRTFEIIQRQLDSALDGRLVSQIERTVFAYEPVWAIGTGKNATPDQAQEVHAWIRRHLRDRHHTLGEVRIQYGGSVTATNAASILQQPDVDGALVGGASLTVDAFSAIVKAAAYAKSATLGEPRT